MIYVNNWVSVPIKKPLSIILVLNNLSTRYFIVCCNNTNIPGLSLRGGGFKPHGLFGQKVGNHGFTIACGCKMIPNFADKK